MKLSRNFELEVFYGKWEFSARYNISSTDMQSIRIAELLEMTGTAREWRSHTALTAHFEAATLPSIPPAPAAMPLPASAGSGERLPRRLSPALVRIYLGGFILVSGWIVGTTLLELAGVVAIDRVALVTGVVGLPLFTMKPIRMMMRLLVQALRI